MDGTGAARRLSGLVGTRRGSPSLLRRGPLCAWALAAWVLLTACGGNDGGDGTAAGPAFQLDMTGVDASGLPKGLSAQLSLMSSYEEGSAQDVSLQATWRSDDTAVATVDAQGRLTAVAEGQAVLTASYCDASRCDTARRQVRVVPPVVVALSLGPADAYAGPGKALQLSASGRLSDGGTAAVTQPLHWSSDNPAVLQVQPGDGRAVGQGPGQSRVTATLGAVQASMTVTVTAGEWVPVQALAVRLLSTHAFAVDARQALAVGPVVSQEGTGIGGSRLQSHAFDLPTRTWTNKGSPSNSVNSGFTLTALRGGDVLLAGGMYFNLDGRDLYFRACSRYSAATGRWITGLPTPDLNHSSGAAGQLGDGRVLLIGGMDSRPSTTAVTDAFDPATNTWSTLGTFAGITGGRPVTLLDGRLLLLGSTALVFDGSLGQWLPTGAPADARSGVATVLRDGRVLLTGATGTTSATDSPRAEIYDPATGAWSSTTPMSVGRSGHAAVLLPDGSVMVAGGRQASASRSVERYDPTTGQWTAMAAMGTARNGLSLVLLGDGTVMAVGGNASPGLTSAELYW